jgi:hypothetical protein
MKNQNSTQITDAIRPVTPIKPDFTHRYCASLHNDSGDLTDSVGLMTDRALGVLALISSQFEGDVSVVNNNLIYLALDSVTQELQDIRAYLKAYTDSKKEFDVGAYLKTFSDSQKQ